MATSSVASTSSGTLDVQSLVSQLMTIERQPINKLNIKVASSQTKLSTLGTIKGLVSDFQTALQTLSTKIQSNSATSSDASILSATAGTTATAGAYSINVTTLAQAHKLAAAGQISDTAAISAGASTVTFNIGTASTNIAIAAGATLQDIKTSINGANIGVTATIINDGSGTPYRLALSSNNTGASSAISSITVQAGGDASINDLLAYNPTANVPTPVVPMTQTLAATDADFNVNGIRIIKSSNTVTDAIEGVSLNLNKVGATNLTVARDTSSVNTAATSLVDSYNALYNKLKTSSAYGSSTKAAPDLAGDGTVRMMMEQMRGILGSPATPASGGSLTTLSQVGIGFQTDGTLKVDSSKLNNAMSTNYNDVANLFTSTTGFVTRLNTWAESTAQYGGTIDRRTESINTSIKGFNDQISKLEYQMTVIQQRYTKQYSDLNLMLSRMDSTSVYLTQQFKTGG